MRDLGTIGGTAVFLINGLNNRGQIVGGMNVAGDQSYHPFLWDGVSLRDLGTLGGIFGSANALNEAGEVVGFGDLPGDTRSHAALWTQMGRIIDLGTVGGDQCSIAYAINSKVQIVGISATCDFATVQHAFLWENGQILDLNTLVPSGSAAQLTVALSINKRGEIASQGVLPNGDLHAFLLIPCDEDHPGVEGCDYSLVEAPSAVPQPIPTIREASSPALPQSLLRRMSRYHFPGRAFGPTN